ncbi:MAG: hypothetical protein ACTSQE_13500 [Candidatus Heimdallarchaeaceae archaeon]
MGKVYSLKCPKCGFKAELLEGVGKYSSSPSKNFFCENCNKISHNSNCKYCGKKLTKQIMIPKIKSNINTQELFNLEREDFSCPKCNYSKVKFSFSGEWD